MNDLLIYIGDELLDLFPNTAFGTTLKIAEIGDLKSRWVSYTNQFKVPFTDNNDRIYQHARDIRSSTRLPYTQQMVTVKNNGVEIISNGLHVLKKASDGYEMQVFFREFGFFKTIEGRKLSNLSGFKESFDDPRTFRNTTAGLIYPVVNPGSVTIGDDLVKIPFWYYSEVIDKIFSDAGYMKSGNIFDNEKYQKMIINVSGSVAGYDSSFIAARSVDVAASGSQVISLPDGTPKYISFTTIRNGGTNPLGYWDGSTKYLTNDPDIHNDDIVFDANVRFNLVITGDGLDVRIRLVTGPNTILDIVDVLAVTGTPREVRFDYTGDNPVAVSFPSQMNGTSNGMRIEIQRINATTGTINVLSGDMQIVPLPNPSTRTFVGSAPYAYYANLLPDMTQTEFLKDFMVRFGLLCSETNGVMYFKDYDEILSDVTGKDWSSKRVKQLDEVEFNPLTYARENNFDYSGSDDFTKSFDASGSIDIDNDNISSSKTIYTSPFFKSITIGVNDTYPILCALIPVLTGDPLENFNWWNESAGPRLLLVRDKYAYEPNYPGPGAATALYKIGYFDDDNQDYTLRFQQFIDDHYELLTAILQDAKLVTRRYVLSEIDIASLDFMKPIFDLDSFFLLNTVGPFVPGQNTDVEMLKIGIRSIPPAPTIFDIIIEGEYDEAVGGSPEWTIIFDSDTSNGLMTFVGSDSESKSLEVGSDSCLAEVFKNTNGGLAEDDGQIRWLKNGSVVNTRVFTNGEDVSSSSYTFTSVDPADQLRVEIYEGTTP